MTCYKKPPINKLEPTVVYTKIAATTDVAIGRSMLKSWVIGQLRIRSNPIRSLLNLRQLPRWWHRHGYG